jgi:hypothetical protein
MSCKTVLRSRSHIICFLELALELKPHQNVLYKFLNLLNISLRTGVRSRAGARNQSFLWGSSIEKLCGSGSDPYLWAYIVQNVYLELFCYFNKISKGWGGVAA